MKKNKKRNKKIEPVTLPIKLDKPSKNKTTIKFAKIILLSQKIREESYDHEAANESYSNSGFVDYDEFYGKDRLQSIEEACLLVHLPKRIAYPIYLGMDRWNDMQDWAIGVLGKEANKYTKKILK